MLKLSSFRLVLAAVVTLAVLAGRAPDSRAGEYLVSTCQTSAGTPASAADWSLTAHDPSIDERSDDCARGGPLTLNMHAKTHSSADYMRMAFTAPAGTTIQDYVLWRSVQLGDTYNYRYWEITAGGKLSDCGTNAALCNERDRCHTSEGCLAKGVEGDPLFSENKVTSWQWHGLSSVVLSLTCGASGSCPGNAPGGIVKLHRADFRLTDATAPTFSGAPTGPLAQAGGTVAGVAAATLPVSDVGGGLLEATLNVDGQRVAGGPIDANGGACRAPYTRAVPCKLQASPTLSFDTRKVADGTHDVQLVVTDVAGNTTTFPAAGQPPLKVRVANAAAGPTRTPEAGTPPASCVRTPSTDAERLTAAARWIAARGRGRRVLTTKFGRRVTILGRLTTRSGSPVAGADLCVLVQTEKAGAHSAFNGMTKTDSDGRYRVDVPAGPSRTIRIVRRTGDASVTTAVVIRVRAPVTARARRRASGRTSRAITLRDGTPMRIVGRIGGEPRAGVLVNIQARDGRRWRAFDDVRTRADGTFSFRYTFKRGSGVRHFSVRARVARQSSYPFATGVSPVVRVTVKG